ncbi:MAG TPA: PorV/PorQ family protein [Ignavibacteria bacterium]|nr:PorV/PorQ family protein [Ignavibacteria bacterium]
MKKFLIILSLLFLAIQTSNAQVGSYTGAFARMGFGARGLSMGNAMVSNVFGDVAGYYNPALPAFQEEGIVNLGYTFLSLDRKLNFVGFAKKFKLPKQENGGAGISLSWINSGVSDIDGRDNDTRQIGMFSTSDNQFYLGTSFLLSDKFALGVGFKFYFSKLFDDVTENSIGFDLGAVMKATENLSFGFAVRDLAAKYEWNTSKLYGSTFGNTTEDKFPTIIDFGGSYKLPNGLGSVSLETEYILNPTLKDNSNANKKNNFYLKAGGELILVQQLRVRAGIERIDFSSDDILGNLKPSAGVGFYKNISPTMLLGLDYSFTLESYTHKPIQNISLGFKFK